MDPLDRTAVIASRASRGGFAWVGFSALLARRRGNIGILLETAAAAWIADGLAVASSHAIGRVRPCRDGDALLPCPDSPSLPSNHAAAAFAAAAGLAARDRSLAMLFAPAALVAWSRVRAGVHTPGDVAAGGLLGVAVAGSVRRVAKRWRASDRG
jgi:undecaprenyl-diphosphatase